jgi:parvulin-like peptidyl-prolyl isomerase
VVKSPLGYHVLRVEESQPARRRPLEECRDEIRERLQAARQDGVKKDFVRELMARAKVEDEVMEGRSRP